MSGGQKQHRVRIEELTGGKSPLPGAKRKQATAQYLSRVPRYQQLGMQDVKSKTIKDGQNPNSIWVGGQ